MTNQTGTVNGNRGRTVQTLDVVLASQRPTETVWPITSADLDLLFNCFAWYPAFFAEARLILRDHHFDPGAEFAYGLVFRAMASISDTYG